jgi:hypothetical protein
VIPRVFGVEADPYATPRVSELKADSHVIPKRLVAEVDSPRVSGAKADSSVIPKVFVLGSVWHAMIPMAGVVWHEMIPHHAVALGDAVADGAAEFVKGKGAGWLIGCFGGGIVAREGNWLVVEG